MLYAAHRDAGVHRAASAGSRTRWRSGTIAATQHHALWDYFPHRATAIASRSAATSRSTAPDVDVLVPGVRKMMNDLFSLKGRTALVTGGTRGIGRMIAQGFLEQGAKVYISGRKAEQAEAAAKELSAFGPCIPLRGRCRPAPPVRASSPRPISNGRRASTSSSTMPARPGARRSRSFRRTAGTRSWI